MPRGSSRACLLTVCAVQFLGVLDTSMVSLALPSIARDLELDAAAQPWVLNAYSIAFSGFVLLGGSAADLMGRRRTVRIGLVVLAAAAVIGAFAWNLPALLIARTLQGVGAAVMMPAALALLVVTFDEGPNRHRAFGAWAASGGAALICGGLVGGALTAHAGWRATFTLTALLALGGLLATLGVTEAAAQRGARRIDVTGAVLGFTCLTLLVLGAGRIQSGGWASGAALTGAVLAAIAFIAVQRRSAVPLLRLGLFRVPLVSPANFLALLFPAGFLAALVFGSILFQEVYGFGASVAGLAILPFSVAVLACTALAPLLMARLGKAGLAVAGFALTAIGLLGLAAATTAGYVTAALPAMVATGMGAAFASVPLAVAAVSRVSKSESGMATGLLSTSQQAGNALMLAILTAVMAAWTPSGGGLRAAFIAAAVICAVAGALAARLLTQSKE